MLRRELSCASPRKYAIEAFVAERHCRNDLACPQQVAPLALCLVVSALQNRPLCANELFQPHRENSKSVDNHSLDKRHVDPML